MQPSQNILRLPAAIKKVGLSKSTIYTLLKSDKFVRPIRLSARSIGFLESELNAWLEQKAADRT
jgi:prophage regulatory protein